MIAPHARVPKMKINKFKQILDMPQINKFNVELLDTSIDMTIHVDSSEIEPITYFVFHSAFVVYGWTDNTNDAFTAKGNACIYTAREFYNLLRGQKLADLTQGLKPKHQFT